VPRRDDLHSINGHRFGPIVIGQACEFDYSGTQAVPGAACGRLQGDPGQLQPATIMTDPPRPTSPTSSRSTRVITDILERERPALLPTLGVRRRLTSRWNWCAAA